MTVESLIERLKVAPRTPQNPEKSLSVPAQNTPVSLGESIPRTSRTSRTPEKVERQRKSTELAHTAAPVLAESDSGLLAIAMQLCDTTNASDKARADWRADIAATPVELRGELAAYLQSLLPKTKISAMAMAPEPATKPLPKFDQAQAWREADRAFQAHYWQCPQCMVGGRNRGPLCSIGELLRQATDKAFAN